MERQAEEGKRARLRSVAGYALAGLLFAAVIAAIVVMVTGGAGDSSTAATGGTFGPHYKSLAARRTKAQVPTMMTTMGSSIHVHPRLAIYVNGEQVEIPANIGIDPSQPSMQMAGLHTHDSSGTIHDEGMPGARLGQFFAVWGVPFSADRLGSYQTNGSKTVRMWVDRKPSTAFGDLLLEEGQQIVVSYDDLTAPNPPLN